MKHCISLPSIVIACTLLFSFEFPFNFSRKGSLNYSGDCKHMEIAMENKSQRYYSFDFSKGYTYGSSNNQVSMVGLNGGNLKFSVDTKGRATDLENLHYEYDEEGIHRITSNGRRFGDQTFDFSSGNKLFKAESKDSRGSWSRAIYTYDNNGDPVDIKILSEENDNNQKKVRSEKVTATLSFYPDKPSLDKGNVVMASCLSNLCYALYRENLIVSQHLLKHMTVAFTATTFNNSGGELGTNSFTNESDYSYDYDTQGRPSNMHISSSAMGHTIPSRTFLIKYSNCQ